LLRLTEARSDGSRVCDPQQGSRYLISRTPERSPCSESVTAFSDLFIPIIVSDDLIPKLFDAQMPIAFAADPFDAVTTIHMS
jgi:hypothetical protein